MPDDSNDLMIQKRVVARELCIVGRVRSRTLGRRVRADYGVCTNVTDAGRGFLASFQALREIRLDSVLGVTLQGTRVFPAVCA
jgi:hypothetical protein